MNITDMSVYKLLQNVCAMRKWLSYFYHLKGFVSHIAKKNPHTALYISVVLRKDSILKI